MFAPKGYVRRHDVGKGLGSSKVRRKIEAGIDVTLRNVDDPTVEHRSAPTSRAEGFLPALKYGLDSVLGALINLSRLSYANFSKGVCAWDWAITKFLGLSGGPATYTADLPVANFRSDLASLYVRLLGENFVCVLTCRRAFSLATLVAFLRCVGRAFLAAGLRVDDLVMVLASWCTHGGLLAADVAWFRDDGF